VAKLFSYGILTVQLYLIRYVGHIFHYSAMSKLPPILTLFISLILVRMIYITVYIVCIHVFSPYLYQLRMLINLYPVKSSIFITG